MTRDELEKLAERVESATGPDAEMVEVEIALAIGWTKHEDETLKVHDPARYYWTDADGYTNNCPQSWTSSLDAAVTLVPEGYGWRLWMPCGSQVADGDRPRVTLWGPQRSYAPNDTEAATPALALTAAALRARAGARS